MFTFEKIMAHWQLKVILKSSSTPKCALHIVTSLESVTFSVQNGIYAEFDTRRLFLH